MELLNEKDIYLNQKFQNKLEVITFVINMLNIEEHQTLKKEILQREEDGITCIGNFVALPHIVSGLIKTPKIVIIKNSNLISWYDSIKVKTIIFLLIPKLLKCPVTLKSLQIFIIKLSQEEVLETLNTSTNKKEIINILKEK